MVGQAAWFNLSVGVALTSGQMISLTQDIVWLISVTVNGQGVLQPMVYLSSVEAKAMAASGNTLAAKNVILNASGDITHSGKIAASQNAHLTAGNLLISGAIAAGNNLSVNAAQDILNDGAVGAVGAAGNVSLAAGNDVRSGVSMAKQLRAATRTDRNALMRTTALTSTRPGSVTAAPVSAIQRLGSYECIRALTRRACRDCAAASVIERPLRIGETVCLLRLLVRNGYDHGMLNKFCERS